jgi:hypothetical protein
LEFRINNGPWETIFQGYVFGHEVEIVINPDKVLLVFIYEAVNGKKMGALVESYKPFLAHGPMEPFIQSLPKPCSGFIKNDGDNTQKIFLLSFEPVYLDFQVDDFLRALDVAVAKMPAKVFTIIDLAKAASLDLKELQMAADKDYLQVISDPLALRFFSMRDVLKQVSKDRNSGSAGASGSVNGNSGGVGTNGNGFGGSFDENSFENKSIIGLDKTREVVFEDVFLLQKSLIVAQNKNELFYPMYLLAESFLLANRPIVILDPTDYFLELHNPSKNKNNLVEQKVTIDPIGFPMKNYQPKQNLFFSLRDVDIFLIMDLFGVGDTEFQRKFSLISLASQKDTVDELRKEILTTIDFTDFEKLKAERILTIIENEMPGFFGKSPDIKELVSRWSGGLGRANIVSTKTLSPIERVIASKAILKMLARQNFDKNDFIIFMPDFEEVLLSSPEKTIDELKKLSDKGAGFILGSTKPYDEAQEICSLKLTSVSGKDVAISPKGKSSYRVVLRPPISNAEY